MEKRVKTKRKMTPEEREALREKRRTTTFPVDLPSGQTVEVSIRQGPEIVHRKTKVEIGCRHIELSDGSLVAIPRYRLVRDDDGNYLTAPVKVMGVRVTVRFPDGEELVARACCKPPDAFNSSEGKKLAIKRLLLLDYGADPSRLVKDEHGKYLKNAPHRKPHLTGDDRPYLQKAILCNGRMREAEDEKPATDTSMASGG